MSKETKRDELLERFNDSVIHSDNDARDAIDALQITIEDLENE